MKKFILFLSVCLFAILIGMSYAGNSVAKSPKTISISGTVVDKASQEKLAGALVRIEGTDIKVYTDLEGKFSIDGIVPDTYKINCSMLSYTDQSDEIALGKATGDIDIQLQNLASE